MKRLFAVMMVLVLMIPVMAPAASAYGLIDGLLGGSSDTELPSFKNAFDGETKIVKVGGVSVEVHTEFIAVMDKYEAFFDEYVKFMSSSNPDMLKYASMVAKYADAMAAIERLDEKKMSEGDAAYYAAVLLRIDKKLLDSLK